MSASVCATCGTRPRTTLIRTIALITAGSSARAPALTISLPGDRPGTAELAEQFPHGRLRLGPDLGPRPDTGRAADDAAALLDQVARGRGQLGVQRVQLLGEADPARHRVVDVDRRPLRERRPHLVVHADV